VVTAPYNLLSITWYGVTVQNNIIANNVAGWDGAGVSMEDALKVTMVNNTIVSNDTTASAGVLFKTLGAVDASSPPPGCNPTTDLTTNPQDPNCLLHNAAHIPQPAGLVTMRNTPNLVDAMNGLPSFLGVRWLCPSGYGYSGGILGIANANCGLLSLPRAFNDMFWQNRAFHVEITGAGTGLQSQQNLVSLLPTLNQTVTGQCAAGASYWDVGVRDDTGPTNHNGGATLSLSNSILTSLAGGYTGNGNRAPSSSPVNAQYCNGSRVPPENGGHGYLSPPGRSETTGLSTLFVFNNITPAATVDEGNNWINLSYGPLALFNNAAQSMLAAGSNAVVAGAYSIGAGSNAVNGGTNSGAPPQDFFGNARARTTSNPADIGAVEFQAGAGGGGPSVSAGPNPLNFGTWAFGTSPARSVTVLNTGNVAVTGLTYTTAGAGFSPATGAGGGTCGTTLNAGASCTVNRVFAPTTPTTAYNGTLTIAGTGITSQVVQLQGTGVASVPTVSVTPSTLTITLPTGQVTGSGTVTLTNNAALGGGQVAVTAVNVAGGTVLTWFFSAGSNNCTGAILAPQQSCTVSVNFTNVLSPRGPTRSGSITFTDNGAATASQGGTLSGIATP